MSRYKSTKKRSKLEKLLRQDHSDVYFDNDKLNDQLLVKIDELKREKYRHDLEYETEIFELRKEYRKLSLLKNEIDDEDDDEKEETLKLPRPHTVTGMVLMFQQNFNTSCIFFIFTGILRTQCSSIDVFVFELVRVDA